MFSARSINQVISNKCVLATKTTDIDIFSPGFYE